MNYIKEQIKIVMEKDPSISNAFEPLACFFHFTIFLYIFLFISILINLASLYFCTEQLPFFNISVSYFQ